MSGMAPGWDWAFAWASWLLGIPFIAAVPFEGQESKWPPNTQVAYRIILDKAARVEVVSPGGYAAWKLHKRNEFVVDHCTRIAAMWDGVKSGGTWNTVRYAQNLERPIDCLYERWSGKP